MPTNTSLLIMYRHFNIIGTGINWAELDSASQSHDESHHLKENIFISEFLLGDSILVAPVLEEGALTRDIYLPKGSWKDEVAAAHNLDIIHTGPIWLVGYEADLWTLPYFTKQPWFHFLD